MLITTLFNFPLLKREDCRCSQNVALLAMSPPNSPLHGGDKYSRQSVCSCRPMRSAHIDTTTASKAKAITMERCWRHTTHISAHHFRCRRCCDHNDWANLLAGRPDNLLQGWSIDAPTIVVEGQFH